MKLPISSLHKGFTLIELLVVIAVMGVLATIVLVAVDPAEQFNRAEDGNRKQNVNTFGNAVLQYTTARATLPNPNLTEQDPWITALVTNGELKQIPPAGGTVCDTTSAGYQLGYCYNLDAVTGNYTVYTALESKAEDTDSAGVQCATTTDISYFVYDSSTGKTCKVCGNASYLPVAGACP